MDPDGRLDPEATAPVVLPPDVGPGGSAAGAPVVAVDDDEDDDDVESSEAGWSLLSRMFQPERRGRIAIIDDRASVSYGRLVDRSARFGAGLLRAGIVPGDRVFLCLLDTMDWPMVFLGTMLVGGVPVCADTRLDAAAYETMLRDSGSRLLVVSRTLYPAFDGLLQRIDSLARVMISEAPLADGGDMTVLLSLDPVRDATPRPETAEACLLADGARTLAWLDELIAEPARVESGGVAMPLASVGGEWAITEPGPPAGAVAVAAAEAGAGPGVASGPGALPTVRIEAGDRCLSTGRLCDPSLLGQMLLPALAAGASLVLIAEEQGADAVRTRLRGYKPEHLEGKLPTLLFGSGRALKQLLVDDGLPLPAGLPLRGLVLVDPEADEDGVARAISSRSGLPVFRARAMRAEAGPAVSSPGPAPDPDPAPPAQ